MPKPPSRSRAARMPFALAVAAALLVLAQLGIAAPAFADDTVGIEAKPAAADGKPDGRTRFSYQIEPGKRVSDDYLVQNAGSTPQTFTVVATDAFNNDQGDYAVLDTSIPPTGVGNWVHFENGDRTISKTLAPGEQWLVPFTVLAPPNASPGDHAGGIVASVQVPSGEVIIDRRVASRLYVRVPGDLQAMLSVTRIDSGYSGQWWSLFSGTVKMDFTVQNTGNVALAATMNTGVHTWFGVDAVGVRQAKLGEILPGYGRKVSVTLPAVAQWLYLNPYVSLHPFVEDEVRPQVPTNDANRDVILWAIPWFVLIGVGIIALIVLLRLLWLRREARRAREWVEYQERESLRAADEDAAPVRAGGRD
jgi:hypothetical protein